MQDNLNQKMGQATKWSSITEIGTKLVTPITNAILARLLTPEAFGVVATLTLVVSFAEVFTDAGFQKYLVQHEFTDEEDLDLSTNVAFWTNLVFSLLIWAGIAVFAPLIANLVGSAGHEMAIIVMSAEIPLLAFSSIQMARYRRDFDFKNLFVSRMAVALVPLVVTVPAALYFRSHWALVIGTLAKDILNAVILTARSRWKPAFRFSVQKLKEMVSFSIWTTVERVTIWCSSYAGTLIVGSTLGSYHLGLYKTTTTTVSGYFGIITNATMPVLFSALSRVQDNDEEFQNIYFRFQRTVAMLVIPLGFGMFIYRDLGTLILLGDQWMETADFFGMWSLASAILIVFSYYNSEAFRAKGKPKLSVVAQLIYLAVSVPVLQWAAQENYDVLAIVSSAACLSLMGATVVIAQATLKIRFAAVLNNVWPSLISAVIMAFAGMGLQLVSDHIVWQILSVFLCVIVYALCMLLIPAGRRQLAEIPVLDKLLHLKKTDK